MPRRKAAGFRLSRPLATLAISALLIFVGGEALLLARSERGQVALARNFGVGDRARITQLLGRRIRTALGEVGVTADSIRETVHEDGRAAVRWRIGLTSGASTIQANHAIARVLEAAGGEVLSGREGWTERGTATVTLLVGLPRLPTHELVMERDPQVAEAAPREPARMAVVIYGFGEEEARADSFFATPAPFAVAVVAGLKSSPAVFRSAHEHGREVVLQLPLEPINYPQVNPGPGTLTVTMKPSRIVAEVRRYLDQARPVAAVANHMGSLATQDMTVMSAVYRELRKSRLPFVHVTPVAGAVCKSLASDLGISYEEPDVVIDASDRAALERRWSAALKEAEARGALFVMVRATPASLGWLRRALDPKRMQGVSVVPPSTLLRRPTT
jgi:polysaccharide deacetylase 2 family uncharacterized protein YibQ